MNQLILLFCSVLLILLIVLDASGYIELTGTWLRLPVVFLTSNCVLLFHALFTVLQPSASQMMPEHWNCPLTKGIFWVLLVFVLYTFFRFHFIPFRQNKSGSKRVRILYGGRVLLQAGFWGCVAELLLCLLVFSTDIVYSRKWFCINLAVCTIVFLGTYLYNGALRILCTCRRLGILKRILIIFNMWVPIVNLFLIHYLCKKAKEEYSLECCRFDLKCCRLGSNVCSLKYPLIMVHGIGFRDLRYFNYWGRIPKKLCENGATVYYGHQNAWGTIEENALALKQKIEQVCQETGAEKVNIIAHSKGGLDSRYLISEMDMAKRVASLTTINTPHYGSELINVLNRLPDRIYRLIASWFDRSFTRFGDQKPDCYHSSKQLSPGFCAEFNARYPDVPGVYYQSYASVMNHFFSDSLLSIPYLIMKLVTGEKNDGLVTERSARWTNFRGTFRNQKHGRGISHGDMIDLKREDYRGFDVIEEYITIVSELKRSGF